MARPVAESRTNASHSETGSFNRYSAHIPKLAAVCDWRPGSCSLSRSMRPGCPAGAMNCSGFPFTTGHSLRRRKNGHRNDLRLRQCNLGSRRPGRQDNAMRRMRGNGRDSSALSGSAILRLARRPGGKRMEGQSVHGKELRGEDQKRRPGRLFGGQAIRPGDAGCARSPQTQSRASGGFAKLLRAIGHDGGAARRRGGSARDGGRQIRSPGHRRGRSRYPGKAIRSASCAKGSRRGTGAAAGGDRRAESRISTAFRSPKIRRRRAQGNSGPHSAGSGRNQRDGTKKKPPPLKARRSRSRPRKSNPGSSKPGKRWLRPKAGCPPPRKGPTRPEPRPTPRRRRKTRRATNGRKRRPSWTKICASRAAPPKAPNKT